VALDLADPRGRDLFRRLAATADGVTSNLRGDVPDHLGITHRHLADVNPRIVCAHLTGYGRDGPRRTWPGYDFLMQAEVGWFHLTGDPDGPPSRAGLSLVDLMTGVVMGLGLVSGILRARETGKGLDVDVSLFDLALFNLNYLGNWYLNAGAETRRLPRSAHASLTPCQTYRTKDGWIFLMCNKEKFWPILCDLIGRPDLGADPRFRTFPDRLRERPLLTDLLDDALSARTTTAWLSIFAGKVPAGPINTIGEALTDPYVTGGGRVEEIETEGGGRVRLLAAPLRVVEGLEPTPSRPAPVLGADTDALLAEAGVSAEEIAGLRAAGVVG
jgi:crotonobetainyl-CoA:carnitine CoA-transferase CaiB-like acyl-CoA transferase